MGQSLGSLFIELKANTADFVGGMGKAAYVAQQSARNISREFSSLQKVASQTFGAFGQLNPVISQLSYAFSTMGRAASSAMKEFGSTKTVLGSIASLSAGATVALSSIAIGAIGLATKAAESAGKLYELAQSTGVSVEALSGLGFVARQTGVDSEVMTTGLERMSKSAFVAATAPSGAVNAYTRLGISIRDSAGNILPTTSIFEQLADKFRQMPDGVAKTAYAIEIFGRGGAAMIPILNLGSAAIEEMLASSQRLGVTLSGEAAESAHKFDESLRLVGEAATGAKNKLMGDLLPVLQAIANQMASKAGASHGLFDDLEKGGAALARYALIIGDGLLTVAHEIGQFTGDALGLVWEFASNVYNVMNQLAHFSWSGAESSARDGVERMGSVIHQFLSDSRQDWADYGDFIDTTFGKFPHPDFTLPGGFKAGEAWMKDHPLPSREFGDTSGKGAPVAATEKDTVADLIQKLTAETAAQDALATATDRSTAAVLLQKAAGEAATRISEARTQLLDEQKELTAQLANAKSEQDIPRVAGIEKQIAAVKKYLNELTADTPVIQSLFARIAAPQLATTGDDDVQKFIEETGEKIAQARLLAAAYAKGPGAVADVEEGAKIAPFTKTLEALDALRQKGAITGSEFSVMAAQIAVATAAVRDLTVAESDAAAGKIGEDTELQIAALNRLTGAAFGSAAAMRAVQAENKVQEFVAANPHASADDVAKVRAEYASLDAARHASDIATLAEQMDIGVVYQRKIEQLKQVAAAYGANKDIALAVSAAEIDASHKAIEDWDRQAEAAGHFGQRVQDVFNQIEIQADDFGAKVSGIFVNMVDGISDQLAKLVVTGKSDFKKMFEGIAEQGLKDTFQASFATLLKVITGPPKTGSAGSPGASAGQSGGGIWSEKVPGAAGGVMGTIGKILGVKMPGMAGAKADGSQANPFYVVLASSAAAAGGGGLAGLQQLFGGGSNSGAGGKASSASSGILNSLAGISKLGQNSDSDSDDSDGGDSGSGGGGLLGGLSSLGKGFETIGKDIWGGISKIFGGFFAGGGDPTPGKAFVVGEKGPEIMSSRSGVHITPMSRAQLSGGGRTTNFTMHVHGVTNPDSFQRSQAQIYAQAHAQMALANSRNG